MAPSPTDGPATEKRALRVALYSQGMVGFGHIRRNASIAQALRLSSLQPSVLLIAEAWQAGALLMPTGVDCVTLPAVRRRSDGSYVARFLTDLSAEELVTLRRRVIRDAMKVLEPDVLIVDCLPLGVAGELSSTLEYLRGEGRTHCVLGLRDVLYDTETVKATWASKENLDALHESYDAIWIYGDPNVFDAVREYGFDPALAAKTTFTGYLDQRPRLAAARADGIPLLDQLPDGELVLCVVGGGNDGRALAHEFLRAELPPGATGVLVTGPLMPWDQRQLVHEVAGQNPRSHVLDFVPDLTPLISRADRIIAMGGYNTVCEILSFEKHALIIPRVNPEPEQLIRAQRLEALGLVDVLHPDRLDKGALTQWLARDLGPAPSSRSHIDFGGLDRIPSLVQGLGR